MEYIDSMAIQRTVVLTIKLFLPLCLGRPTGFTSKPIVSVVVAIGV
jgi:hypothetical protein